MTHRTRQPVRQPPRTQTQPTPVQVVRAEPHIWAAALDLADGDPHRLTPHPDGSITVHNQPRRRR